VKAGGPARTLTNLVRELDGRFLVDVVTPDRDLGDPEPFPGLAGRRVTRGTITVYYLDASSRRQVVSLMRRLAANRYDLIMVNSIWDYRYSLVPVMLTSLKVLRGPVLLLPHGELEPGALALKSAKKRLGGPAFRAVYRGGVTLFGATNGTECANIAEWFPHRPVVTTTNNLPDPIPWGRPETREQCLQALYLSRVHPTKGLLQLLAGVSLAKGSINLAVVGPTEDPPYARRCHEIAAQIPDNVSVIFGDLAPRIEIPNLLWNSDCMVLLTAGENYGHVIAEALQAGCPVITTPTTPWTDVIRGGGGEIVENRDDPNEVAAVLDRWAAMRSEDLAAARLRARAAFDEFQAAAGPNIIDLALEALRQHE
jgi:glycosyltransferase involved in cell wall biosynthesis